MRRNVVLVVERLNDELFHDTLGNNELEDKS